MLEVILGSANLDDLLDRVDSVRRISNQDVHIIEAVRDARAEVERRGRRARARPGSTGRGRRGEGGAGGRDRVAARRAAVALRLDRGSDRGSRSRGARAPGATRRGGAAARGGAGAARRGSRSGGRRPVRRRGDRRLQPAGHRQRPGQRARRAGRRDRASVPWRPVRVGRRLAERLRLLGPRRCTCTRSSESRCRTTRPRCSTTASRSPTPRSSPAIWCSQRSRPHGHVHRRRQLHSRSAHRATSSESPPCRADPTGSVSSAWRRPFRRTASRLRGARQSVWRRRVE